MRQIEDRMLQVCYEDRLVGTMVLTADRKAAFEYSDEWLEDGFSISPFSLPLKKQVFVPKKDYFGGLFGIFADSLPDAWGRLLLDRLLRANHINPDEQGVLERLAIVGDSGMGALCYHPQSVLVSEQETDDLDELAEACHRIMNTEYSDKLDELYGLGGTSGGARPKIMTRIDGEDWIIKFPAHADRADIGQMEYDYSVCAKKCGIVMSETRLFPSQRHAGYFGTRRFDRKMDVENMFRRMCFNVFAHNRDDHSKNFSFVYDTESATWRLSPAYDLTYSTTYYGEHTTSVDGNGQDPGETELLTVGVQAGMKKKQCQEIINEIKQRVEEDLKAYATFPTT